MDEFYIIISQEILDILDSDCELFTKDFGGSMTKMVKKEKKNVVSLNISDSFVSEIFKNGYLPFKCGKIGVLNFYTCRELDPNYIHIFDSNINVYKYLVNDMKASKNISEYIFELMEDVEKQIDSKNTIKREVSLNQEELKEVSFSNIKMKPLKENFEKVNNDPELLKEVISENSDNISVSEDDYIRVKTTQKKSIKTDFIF